MAWRSSALRHPQQKRLWHAVDMRSPFRRLRCQPLLALFFAAAGVLAGYPVSP
jgi:hypothetical protein